MYYPALTYSFSWHLFPARGVLEVSCNKGREAALEKAKAHFPNNAEGITFTLEGVYNDN